VVIDNRNRAFHYAVAVSLVLHALLLFALPDLVDTARRAASIPPQIIARLMEPEPAPAPVPAPPMPEKPTAARETPPARKPEPATPTPRVAKPLPQPETPIVQDIRPEPAAPSPAPAAPAPAVPPVAAVDPQPASPAQSAAQPAAPATAQPPAEVLSRDQYRVLLIDEARRHKRYPPLARENNWQGDVRVGVAVAANGRPTVTLKGSSGYQVLDRQALEMFTQAARAVPIPPALRGKEFALEVRAVYGLED
jgi:periplasmic protein TonB